MIHEIRRATHRGPSDSDGPTYSIPMPADGRYPESFTESGLAWEFSGVREEYWPDSWGRYRRREFVEYRPAGTEGVGL